MACPRCGQSRGQSRPVPPPSIQGASGNQVPRPGSAPARPVGGIPQTPVGNAISGLKYVPGK